MANLLDFQTVLWPEVKTSNVGFYRKPYAGFPAGSVIQAPFTRAGAGRKVINASGNLVDAAANVPAWTFPIGGRSAGCPYLSFLPSVENLLTYSEQFDNVDWTKEDVSISANSSTSPDGTANADTITENSAVSAQHRISQSFTYTSSVNYTMSCWVKRGTGSRNFALIAVPAGIRLYFDLDKATLETATLGSGGILPFGDYYFVWGQGTAPSTAAGSAYWAMTDGITAGSETYNGDGTSSLILWGAQLKEGSYISPLDYVKTEASAVTRSADDITNITDLQGDGYLSTTSGSLIYQTLYNGLATGTSTRFALGESGVGTKFSFRVRTDGLAVWDEVNTTYASIGGSDILAGAGELARYVFVFNSTSLTVYFNGFVVYTASGDFTANQLTSLDTLTDMELGFKMLNFAPTALTANQAEAASSWPSRELMFNDLGLTQA